MINRNNDGKQQKSDEGDNREKLFTARFKL